MSTAAEMSGCQKLVNWILCCKNDELSDLNQKGRISKSIQEIFHSMTHNL